mgnify:FL=1
MNHFIDIKDISKKNLKLIIKDAKKRKIKRKKFNNVDLDRDAPLKGKLLIMMFEKPSTRTRMSFYLAMRQCGGNTHTIRAEELHLGIKGGESIHDTAKILSNYGDIFMLRSGSHNKILEFKKYLKIPIICGLSPKTHATQILSDVFTIEEIKGPISKLNISWIGDSNNVLNSLIEASVKFSFQLNIACPKKYQPTKKILNWAKKNESKIHLYHDAKKAAYKADVVITDKWISMGDKVNKLKKIKDFKNFQINSKLMKHAKKDAIFLHCLPASRGQEVSAEVIDGKQSKVWQQALNRVHLQKSILIYTIGKLR